MTKVKVDDMQNRLKQMIQELGDADCSKCGYDSSASLSDYSDLSDDMLSCVSDVSSVASFVFNPLKDNSFISKGSNDHRQNKKSHKQNPKQSRIPVPIKTKRNCPQSKQTKNSSSFKIAKPIKCSSPPPMAMPTNFLAPDLSEYTHACICIFKGTDFPRSRLGERSTYVVVQLHPELTPVRSPISFNRTTNAVYNGGFNLNCIGINFRDVVPVVEVYDFISEDQNELLGIGFIELNKAYPVDDVCVVLQDQWIDLYTVNTRIRCGKIKMTLIFHNETDISQFVNKDSFVTHPQIVKQQKLKKIEEENAEREKTEVVKEKAVQARQDQKPINENSSIIGPMNEINFWNSDIDNKTNKNTGLSEFHVPNQYNSPEQKKVLSNPFNFRQVRRVPLIIPDEEPDDVPIKQKCQQPPKPEMVFVDENDLSILSDEVFISDSISTKNTKKNQSSLPLQNQQMAQNKFSRPPLQQMTSNPIDRSTEASKPQAANQQKSRYARYADFNMH